MGRSRGGNQTRGIVLRRRDTKESVFDKMLPVDDNVLHGLKINERENVFFQIRNYYVKLHILF